MPKFDDLDRFPREFWATITELAEKSKKDLSAVASEELKKLLQKVDARDLLLKLLSQGTIEIDAKIRIVPNEKKPEPPRTPRSRKK